MEGPVVSGRFPYVAICGPLAAGKTTLTTALAASLGWSTLFENLDANPFFHDYYKDMRRWGFHTVAAFLIRALSLQDTLAAQLSQGSLCQDWYFGEHYDIYGVLTYEEGILDERERRVCESLSRYLMRHTIEPDLVVVLTADPQTLHQRVLDRARTSEENVPISYLEHLTRLYAAWEPTLTTRHIVIDTTASDFAHDETARAAVLSIITSALDDR